MIRAFLPTPREYLNTDTILFKTRMETINSISVGEPDDAWIFCERAFSSIGQFKSFKKLWHEILNFLWNWSFLSMSTSRMQSYTVYWVLRPMYRYNITLANLIILKLILDWRCCTNEYKNDAAYGKVYKLCSP